jgi:hypothetical protein
VELLSTISLSVLIALAACAIDWNNVPGKHNTITNALLSVVVKLSSHFWFLWTRS